MTKLKMTVGLQADLVRTLVREVTVRLATATLPEDWDSIAASLARAELAAKTAALELLEHDSD
jgi:hypothetical protein